MADLHDSPASSRLWSQLTEPTASIQDPEQRRQAQFLATLFVILGPIGIIGVVLPGISNQEPLLNPETLPIYVSAVLIAAMTYVLSRTIWYKAAAWVAVLASSLVIFLSNFIDPTPEGLFYLIIPVLIGGILLSIRATAIVAAVQVVGMSLLPLAIPAADWARTLPYPLAFNIIASVLVLLVARHRNRIERERQAGLVQQIAERRQIEQQLRYQANLLENVTDAIISTDLQFKIQSWNQAAEAIYGWSAQEALGRNIDELLHATFPNDTPQEVLQRFQANGFWRGEVSHQRKDGSRVYILSSVSLVRDSAGMPVGSVGVNRDITTHKMAEAAEREQRLLAEALRDTAAAINSTLNFQEVLDRILVQVERVVPYESANIMLIESGDARVVHCRGYAERAFILEEVLALRFPVAETENLRQMVETGQPCLVSDTRNYAHWRHVEQTTWIRSYIGAPIQSEGDVIGFVNLDNAQVGAFDQTHAEHLQAFANQAAIAIQNARLYDAVKSYAGVLEDRVAERTAQLERQRAQLQTILDAMNDGVVGIMYDAAMQPQTRLMNRALTRLIGYRPEEWDFHLLRSLNMTVEEFAEVVRAYEWAVEKIGFWQSKMRLRRKDGSEFDAELTVTRVNDADDQIIGIVIVIRDISQEKLLQEQRSRFVANASHELRTPITNLLTRLYLLRKQPERLPEHLDIMEQVAGRMRSLVEDLLEHSRFERGVIPLHRTEVDLRLLLADVIRIQQPEADAKRINMTYRLPERPLMVLADSGRMTQVFTNLITNAVNYTPEGGHIGIDCTIEDGDGPDARTAVVHVTDSGVGIAPELLPNIFHPFYRGNEHTKGTGLGLSIAKEIVEMHGGSVAVESQIGHGSRFTVRLALIVPTL